MENRVKGLVAGAFAGRVVRGGLEPGRIDGQRDSLGIAARAAQGRHRVEAFAQAPRRIARG